MVSEQHGRNKAYKKLRDALNTLQELENEYKNENDNMPKNLDHLTNDIMEKLNEIIKLLENIDLPGGFGKD